VGKNPGPILKSVQWPIGRELEEPKKLAEETFHRHFAYAGEAKSPNLIVMQYFSYFHWLSASSL